MRLFIKNLIFFGMVCLAFFALILAVEKGILNHQNHFQLPAKDKYLFLGHSHTQMAVNDSLVDSSINLASAGEAYFYTYIKLNKILEHNTGKRVVFIAYSNNSIVSEMNSWIWDDIHIMDRYRLYSAYTPISEMKVLYENNPSAAFQCNIKSIVNNIYYIFNLKNISEESKMGGYIYLVRDKTDSLLQAISKNHEKVTEDTTISNTNIIYLKKIIAECKAMDIPVYLMRNPLHHAYRRIGNEARFRKILNTELAGTELLDFKDFPLKDSDYGDLEHLNYRGAKKYSLFINQILKKGLLDSTDKQKFIQEQMAQEE